MRHFLKYLLMMPLLCWMHSAHAQETFAEQLQAADDDNGFIINLLQDQLSTESRKIRLSGISGLLSSQATVQRITISDQEGVWLLIENASVDWNRSALFSGRVQVNSLAAENVIFNRTPIASDSGLPSAEATSFQVPELPVAVALDNLNINRLQISDAVFGTGALLSLQGNLEIGDGAMAAGLELQRLDGPGGEFTLQTSFENATNALALDMELKEPPNGLAANLASIHNTPALDLKISGGGPLSDLLLTLDFSADDESILTGDLGMSGQESDRVFSLNLNGDLSTLIAPQFRSFFEGRSELAAGGRRMPGGGLALDELELKTGAMYLSGWLVTTSDGFLSDMLLTGALSGENGAPVLLPTPDGNTYLRQANLDFTFDGNSGWGGSVNVEDLQLGDTIIGNSEIVLSGNAENSDQPDARRLTGQITSSFSAISSTNADVAKALGDRIELATTFDWQAGQPFQIGDTRISGNNISLSAEGQIDQFTFDGDLAADIGDLAVFAPITNRALSGALNVKTSGSITPFTGAFALTIDGSSTDLALGIAGVDGLLAGETQLDGRLVRGADGLDADGFQVRNAQAEINVSGHFGTDQNDMALRAAIRDLNVLDANSQGAVDLTFRATGPGDAVAISANIAMPDGALSGRDVQNLSATLAGEILSGKDFEGRITGIGTLGDNPIFLSGDLSLNERIRLLKNFGFSLADTRIEGTVGQGGDGLFSGTFSFFTQDIAPIAGLFLTQAEGAIDLKLELSRAAGQQRLRLNGDIGNLDLAGISAERATTDLDIIDLFGLPLAAGSATGDGLILAGFGVDSFAATFDRIEQQMQIKADSVLANGTNIALLGALENLQPGVRLLLQQLSLDRSEVSAALLSPASIEVIGSNITISDLNLKTGDGSVRADGRFGELNDLRVDADAVPFDIANLIVDMPGIGGFLSGSATITGSQSNPDVAFDVKAQDASLPAMAALGLPPLQAAVQGETRGGRLSLMSNLVMEGGLSATLNGSLPMDADETTVDLNLGLERFPLAMIDAMAGRQGLSGTITGSSQITGSIRDPEAAFDLQGDVSAQVLRENGIGALGVALDGNYKRFEIGLNAARVSGASGFSVAGSGQIPIFGSGLNVSFNGTVPLALANIALASAGTQVSGNLAVDGSATGSLTAPQLAGKASLRGGTLVDPRRNLRVEGLSVDATLSGTEIQISSANGRFSNGGTVSASGRVGLSAGFPSDVKVSLRNARYTDGIAVETTISGDISITGPVLGAGRVVGALDMGKTEVSIRQSFGIREGVLLDVRHRNPPTDVNLTLNRAGLPERARATPAAGSMFLDISVSAPNQIFIRGRGLDVEMGGSVIIRGPAQNLAPIGRFELRRGRISILGQRINFNDGWIALTGTVDPEIRLEAETQAQSTVVYLLVTGPVSDPQIELTSSPELPQDEILSLLIFQRDLSELSPLQLLRLAAATAELAGRGGGAFDRFRSSIGLDDLELSADEEGALGVRAGAYLSDRLYLDVEADLEGGARATINLDVADHVRAKTSLGSDGNSSIGIFYERDY